MTTELYVTDFDDTILCKKTATTYRAVLTALAIVLTNGDYYDYMDR